MRTLLVLALVTGCHDASPPVTGTRTFVAVQDDGVLAELDGETGALARRIDLASELHAHAVPYMVHNAQAAPDGDTVWVTAMPDSANVGHAMADELIGVDVASATVRARIPLGQALYAAHVVVHDRTAYVTAMTGDAIIVVDLDAEAVARTIALPTGTQPHGLRLTPDGAQLVVAGMGDGSLHVVQAATGATEAYALPGRAVQTAVLADGAYAFATVYDTRQIARLDLATRELVLFDLPGAAGPIQLYPTSDEALWIADQGMMDGDPPGHSLFRMRASDGTIDLVADVPRAPHGVVVSGDGSRVWTTTLIDGDVVSLDAATGEVLSDVHVGDAPNGITVIADGGAMP